MPLFTQLRSFPRPAWIVFGGVFINRFGSFVLPMLVFYLTQAGFSAAQAGFAIAAYGGGHLVASAVGGHLADRIGRRNTIAVSMFGSAIAMLALSQAHAYAAIVILTFAAGCAAEMYRPASVALITDVVPPEHRAIAFGMNRFAVNLGFAIGPAMAGFLAGRSYFLLFLGDAITSIAYGVIALVALPHGLRTYTKDERSGEALRVAARDKPFLVFLLSTVLVTTILFQFGSTLPLHVTSIGYGPRVYGALLSINGVLIITCELLITAFVQRFNMLYVLAAGDFLIGLGFALTGVARSIPLLAATVVLWTVGEMVQSPVAATYVANIAPIKYRGRYLGFYSLAWSIGLMGGSWLGTLVFERSPAVLWSACALLGAVAAALLLAQSRRIAA